MTGLATRTAGWHRLLLAFAAVMGVLSVLIAIALLVDTRQLDGMPIWAKPLKFAVSFAIYGFTWAWLFSLQRRARRWGQWLGTTLVVASVVEMAIIGGQAARGHRSHFNSATPLDTTLYSIMGGTIAVLFLANLAWAILVLRDQSADRTNAWALRLGLMISTIGLGLGGLMLSPTEAQLRGEIEDVAGAHSVGVNDGGPGLPILGWSTVGGDLRIPHFVGMHAMQILPLLALALLVLSRRIPVLRGDDTRARLVMVFGGGYAGLVALVTWQALRGQALIRPDELTLAALAVLVLTLAAATALALRRTGPGAPSRETVAAPLTPQHTGSAPQHTVETNS